MSTRPTVLGDGRVSLLARLVANGLAQAGAMVATALLVKEMFDLFLAPSGGTKATVNMWWYSAGLVLSSLLIAALRMLERIDAEHLGQQYTHALRTTLFGHMSRLTPRVLQQRSRGGVLLRFVGDLTALKQWVSLGLARLTVAGITSIGAVTALVFISPHLALLVALSLVAGAVCTVTLGRWLEDQVREVRKRRTRLASNVSEKISALGSIQVYGQVNRERRRVQRQSQRLATAMVGRAKVIGAIRAVVELTAGLATGGALIAGTLLVSRGDITAGTVVAAMSIVGLLTPALRDLGRVKEFWHGAIVSWEKMDSFLALPAHAEDCPNAMALPKEPGELVFKNVTVAGGLKNFSAMGKPGETIALVGPNGAGKSTVLALVARLLNPDQGMISLNGQDIASVKLNSLHQTVSLVSPDLPLLRGTVDRNLRYRWPDAPKEELARIRALCGIDDMLTELAQGAETRVREDGSNLSLGQRQRLALARGILGNPTVLLLDELDANLDPSASIALRRVLADYPGTVLMITHRLDWAAMADTVWYLKDGARLETGSANQLLYGDGLTADLFHRPRAVGGDQ